MRIALLLSDDAVWGLGLAARWGADGDEVDVVLLDDAAAVARPGHAAGAALAAALGAGATVRALDESLRRRALDEASLAPGVKAASLDDVAELVVDLAQKVVWL